MLACPAESITVLTILEALEGPLVVVPEGLPEAMSAETDVVLSSLWDELRTIMQDHLSAVTLQDLAQRAQLNTGELMYEI